ncbi:MAG: hypothetical protein QOH61_2112 [Chloroflexota bacterium]|nr:hypothetical protein [Chloroflexota bacterium]
MRRTSVSRAFVLTIAALLAVPALVPVPVAADPGDLEANVVPASFPKHTTSYRTIDYGSSTSATDDRNARTSWRIVEGTGNCCEVHVTTAPNGRLFDFGGTYINYSDDRGVTWKQVMPLTPLVNGEGSIVVAPGGDILGVGWDPYSGDHLQSYKYEASTHTWLYNEMPLHQPFYDREWISVVPGPVTIGGVDYPYVSFIKGGQPKEVWFRSTDGLHYTQVTSKVVDQVQDGTTTKGRLHTKARALNDWVQPISEAEITPLGNGNAIASGDADAEWGLFHGDTGKWTAYRYGNNKQPQGRFQVDAEGEIHNVIPSSDGTSFLFRSSEDDGRTWLSSRIHLPEGMTIELWDFRANHSARVAAVAVHAHNLATDTDQDLVFKLDLNFERARLMRMYYVGRGDVNATEGVGNDIRLDFSSITIFPDGRVATSVLDSTMNGTPALAIEKDTTLGSRIKPKPVVTPTLGTKYATWTWNPDAQGWTTAGTPTWSRGAPGMKNGADDGASASYGIEGPQYIDNMSATLTSPPVATDAGASVVQFWLKSDTEAGFDFVHVQWSSNGTDWHEIAQYSGKNPAYPNWSKLTVGFTSPGGNVQVRFQFTSDMLCSAVDTPLCGEPPTGARVDQVVLGKQAP